MTNLLFVLSLVLLGVAIACSIRAAASLSDYKFGNERRDIERGDRAALRRFQRYTLAALGAVALWAAILAAQVGGVIG